MAKRKKAIGLTIDKGQYVKAIGYCLSKGGNQTARRWYLGPIQDGSEAASGKVEIIKAAWKAIKAAGGSVWPEGCNPLATGFDIASVAGKPPTDVPTLSGSSLTLAKAKELYLKGIEQRKEAGQVSHAYWSSETFNLCRGVDLLGTDKPLSAIGATELTAAVLSLAARPLAKPTKGQKTEPKPISVKSAKSYLNSLKYFLDEMSKTETAPGSNQP